MRTAYWAINQEKKETYMSKNLTRKGLALGAVVALGSSLFAGAPAFAAAALQVAPATGTGYTVLSSDTFAIKVVGNSEYTLNADSNLFWKITKPASTNAVAYTLSPSATDNTAESFSTSTVEYLDATARTVASGTTTLTLDPTLGTSASADFVVQAFIESGLTDGLDANDTVVAPAVTVKFVRGADLLPVVTLDQAIIGTALTGTVTFPSTDFNYGQSNDANTDVEWNVDGGAFSTSDIATTRDTANTAFEFEISNNDADVDAGENFGVRAETVPFDSGAKVLSTIKYSTAATASDATAQKTSVSSSENVGKISDGNYRVRTGTKSFSYRVDFTKASEVQAVAAGQPVQITVIEDGSSDATLVTNDVVRVNGKALKGSSATLQTVVTTGVTDATGGITINVESDLGLVSDKIQITVAAAGTTGFDSVNTFEWTDAAYSSFEEASAPLGTATRSIKNGTAVSIKYEIRDQFGKLWTKTGTTYQLRAVGSAGTLVLNTTVDFADGAATLSFTDNSTEADTDTLVTASLFEKTTGNFAQNDDLGSDAAAVDSGDDTVVSTLNIVTAVQAAVKITPGIAYTGSGYNSTIASSAAGVASATAVRTTKTLKALDLRSNKNGSSLGITAGDGVKVSGTVNNADGSAAAGVPVTISATGVFFSTNSAGSEYVSAGTITVNSSATGTYEAYVHSNKGGTFTVTIAAGSVTKTQAIKFAAAAATSGSAIAITAPLQTLPGRAVDVKVLLTDKNGAPVTTADASDIDVTLTGVGYATTIADDTDADGLITFKVIYGANEIGNTTITVKYDGDGSGTTYLPVTATSVIAVVSAIQTAGATANVAGSTKRFFVSVDGNTSARNVVVKVAGKTFKTLKGSTAKKSYVVAAPKGSHKVTVFVGGKLIATKTISVK
jgi:hypothetical protein